MLKCTMFFDAAPFAVPQMDGSWAASTSYTRVDSPLYPYAQWYWKPYLLHIVILRWFWIKDNIISAPEIEDRRYSKMMVLEKNMLNIFKGGYSWNTDKFNKTATLKQTFYGIPDQHLLFFLKCHSRLCVAVVSKGWLVTHLDGFLLRHWVDS